MGRGARSFYPGVPTHLTCRGVDEQPIFLSDLDRYELLALLRKATERIGWQVLCWCLMTTHYHLLVVVPRRAARVVGDADGQLRRTPAGSTRRHRRRGHLFGDRFADTLVESDPHRPRGRSPTSSTTPSAPEW